MFGVYDGHGPKGDKCSQFTKNSLPKLIAKYIRQGRIRKHKEICDVGKGWVSDPNLWPNLPIEQCLSPCEKAHLECNENIQKDKVEYSMKFYKIFSFHI